MEAVRLIGPEFGVQGSGQGKFPVVEILNFPDHLPEIPAAGKAHILGGVQHPVHIHGPVSGQLGMARFQIRIGQHEPFRQFGQGGQAAVRQLHKIAVFQPVILPTRPVAGQDSGDFRHIQLIHLHIHVQQPGGQGHADGHRRGGPDAHPADGVIHIHIRDGG